jgi:ABC-type branched-subunit amino acid transport system ATPase component
LFVPLFGREDQLLACQVTLDPARRPSAVVLIGAPGVGKTSLLRAATAAAPSAAGRF